MALMFLHSWQSTQWQCFAQKKCSLIRKKKWLSGNLLSLSHCSIYQNIPHSLPSVIQVLPCALSVSVWLFQTRHPSFWGYTTLGFFTEARRPTCRDTVCTSGALHVCTFATAWAASCSRQAAQNTCKQHNLTCKSLRKHWLETDCLRALFEGYEKQY